jgi:predicted metal-binding membrane protein
MATRPVRQDLSVSVETDMSQPMLSQRKSRQMFLAASALLFVSSAVMTIAWGAPMSSMDEMPMPGDWSMSMTWMRMPGETWFGAAASFVGMWITMMTAMMLPSFMPMLWRYREAVSGSIHTSLAWLSTVVGAGYFLIWTLAGMVIFPVGATLALFEMHHVSLARAVPLLTGLGVLLIGVLQFSAWKVRQLACCRVEQRCCRSFSADVGTAWRHGIRLGIHCVHCCAGLTVVLLIMGVMDLRAMAVVTAAITAERLAPGGARVAQTIGVGLIGAGLFLLTRAVLAGLA